MPICRSTNRNARTRYSPTWRSATGGRSARRPCAASSNGLSMRCAPSGGSEEQVQHVIDRMVEMGFNVHRSTGVIHTVLGGVGGKGDFDLTVFDVMDGVKEAHRIASPYKLASRSFRP